MSLASALLKQVLEEANLDTWSNLRKIYLPSEYHNIHSIVEGHVDKYHKLPTFEELKFEVRDRATSDKITLIEREEVDAESFMLLDYLKSEFAQKELLSGMSKFLDESVAFSNAEDAISGVYDIVSKVEDKVDIRKPSDSIERVELFDTEEEMEASLRLGLNEDYDKDCIFPNTSLILLGGYRGSGKSIICNNIAQHQHDTGKTAIKFTIEMSLREELQRQCAIATGVPHVKIRYKELSVLEWEKVALWWAARYEDGLDVYEQVYLKDRDFSKFHSIVSKRKLANPAIDFVHTPDLTIAKLKAETLKRLNKYDNVGVVIVDYLNKMKNSDFTQNKFDWIEQIQVSDKLKTFSEEIGIPIVSPFQTKADGGVKFSKDILVPADAVFNINKGDGYLHFENTKMRHMVEKDFVSQMHWDSLKCGPESAELIEEEPEETPQDLP